MGERIIDYYHIPDLNIVNKSLINIKHHIDEENMIQTLKKNLEESEKGYILSSLIRNNMNKEKTAEELGITVRNLYYKLKKYRIK